MSIIYVYVMTTKGMMMVLSAVLCTVAFSSTAALAGGYEVPAGTIGVSEATFKHVKQAECSAHECDSLLVKLSGKVIMRVENGGALYRVVAGSQSRHVLPYVPNGVYAETKNGDETGRLFYINAGFKVRLDKEDMFNHVQSIAHNHAHMTLGISEDTFSTITGFMDGCSFFGAVDAEDEQACSDDAARRNEVREQLAGTLLIRAQGNGELYYIAPGHLSIVHSLDSTVRLPESQEAISLVDFFSSYSEPLSKKIVKKYIAVQ